jgi:D-glycero-beta-D-manno-heptose 1-phosphate adenylyltransferase
MNRNPEDLIMSLEAADAWRQALKKENRKLAITNGCFDILHRGHADYLYRAREQADALLVLINSDASVQALKGPNRPVMDEHSRAYLLCALECVDAVVIFSEQRCTKYFSILQPDVYIKGGDYTIKTLNNEERIALQQANAEFRFIPFVEGFSTTNIISRIKAE